jgi:hypothetical protein
LQSLQFTVYGLCLFLLASSLNAWGQSPDPREEFTAIADDLFAGNNLYYGAAPLDALRQQWQNLNQGTPGPLARYEIPAGIPFSLDVGDMSFTRHLHAVERANVARDMIPLLLRAGHEEEARDVAAQALADAQRWGVGDDVHARLLFLQGLTHLRLAEQQNCVARHNAACCIFPLQAAGVHTQQAPAAAARESLRAYLELEPDDDGAKWLLNVVAMTLGDYPEGVQEAWRIPPAAFASDHTVAPFIDIAPNLGVDSLDILGGVSVEDFDGDGYLDLFATTNHPYQGAKLFRNAGDGSFQEVSESAGVTDQLGAFDCTAGDYDNDGDMDLYLVRGAWMPYDGKIRNSLLRNNGNMTFTDVTHAAGLASPAYPSQAGVWGDFNNDGLIDLYVANESYTLLAPGDSALAAINQLFMNNGDGTFTDNAAAAGVAGGRQSVGATGGDFNNDGLLDLYVVNYVSENQLLRNNGDGTFTDVADTAGVTQPAARDSAGAALSDPSGFAFPAWFFDYNNDGWLDIFVTAYTATNADLYRYYQDEEAPFDAPCLYRNNGDGTFTNVTDAAGLNRPLLPMGAGFGDVDMDGWLDMFLGTGNPFLETLMPNVLLRNDAGQTFQDVTAAAGVGNLQKGHGVSFADLDNDGDQDIFHQIGGIFPGDPYYNALYLNTMGATHYLYLHLVGVQTNRGAVGARVSVTVTTPTGPRTLHRAAGAVSSFGETPARMEVGLGDATGISEVTVFWPVSGTTQTFTDIQRDTAVRITEGAASWDPVTLSPMPFTVSEKGKP